MVMASELVRRVAPRQREVSARGSAVFQMRSPDFIGAAPPKDHEHAGDAKRDHVQQAGLEIAKAGSFAQRYVKRHELTQPFQADFKRLSGYVRGNIGIARSSQS